MLKFISQNEKFNEDTAKQELELKTSLLDFFCSKDSSTIRKTITNTLADIKQESKKLEYFYSKLLYYFSLIITKNSFDDKIKKSINNIIEVCESQSLTSIYSDLYNLFSSEQKEPKKYVLSKFLESQYKFNENDYLNGYVLIINYFETNKIDKELIENFAKFVYGKKNYELLSKKIANIKLLYSLLSKEKELINKSAPVSKLYFYITMTHPDLVDIDLEKNLGLNSELKEEIKLLNLLEDREDKELLFEYKEDNLIKEYGDSASEKILIGIKENSLHEIILTFVEEGKKIIKFKDLINEIYDDEEEEDDKKKERKEIIKDEGEVLEKFGWIEDMLVAGNEHGLYNVVIDYYEKEFKVLYIRRAEFEEEQKKNLLKNVKDMKSKLEKILKVVEKI